MKKLFFPFIFLFFMFNFSSAQKPLHFNKWSKVSISFSSFGINQVFRLDELTGSQGFESKNFTTYGLHYIHPLSSWLDVEAGFEYSHHKVLITPELPPSVEQKTYVEHFSIINIPATFRITYLNNLYINTGPMLNIAANSSGAIDEQTGIGGLFGIGGYYQFIEGYTFFINPYLKVHTLVPFTLNINQHRMWEAGIRMGISFDLMKYR